MDDPGPETQPLVSIAIPVRNGMEAIQRAVDAALAQDYRPLEIVVSDNASTDGTSEWLAGKAQTDSRLKHHRSDVALSLRDNWHRAFELSDGDYVKWAAHDDWYAPSLVSSAMDLLARDTDAVCAYPWALFVRDEGTIFAATDDPAPGANGVSRLKRFHRAVWSIRSYPAVTAGVTRRSALLRTGMVRNVEPVDKVLALELSLLGSLLVIPEPLLFIVKTPEHLEKNEWVYNDPANAERRRRRSQRTKEALQEVFDRQRLGRTERLACQADLAIRFVSRRSVNLSRRVRDRIGDSSLDQRLRHLVNGVPPSRVEVPASVRELLFS